MWGNGAVTLPKKWRTQFPTKHFMAVEKKEGLLIKPILNAVFYEDAERFGIHFPDGIPADELLKHMKKISKKLDTPRSRRHKK